MAHCAGLQAWRSVHQDRRGTRDHEAVCGSARHCAQTAIAAETAGSMGRALAPPLLPAAYGQGSRSVVEVDKSGTPTETPSACESPHKVEEARPMRGAVVPGTLNPPGAALGDAASGSGSSGSKGKSAENLRPQAWWLYGGSCSSCMIESGSAN